MVHERKKSGVIHIRISGLWTPLCQISSFFNIWSKKGPSELGGLIADSQCCPETAVSLKATKVPGRNR